MSPSPTRHLATFLRLLSRPGRGALWKGDTGSFRPRKIPQPTILLWKQKMTPLINSLGHQMLHLPSRRARLDRSRD